MNRQVTLKSIVAVVLMAVLFAGCSSDKGMKSEIPVFDVEGILTNVENVNLSEYASEINYLPLETSESSLVNGSVIVNKIVPAENGVILFIRNSGNIPMVFDHNGKFVSKIGNHGRTSSEFQQIHGVLPSADGVELVDYNKILVYDNEYNFVRSFPCEFNLGDICKTENGKYIYLADRGLQNKEIKVSDREGNVILSKKNGGQTVMPKAADADAGGEMLVFKAVAAKQRFFNINGEPCIYFEESKDTLHTILEDGELEPRYIINYGKYDEGVDLNMFVFDTDKFILSRFLFNAHQYPNIDQKYRFLNFIYDKSQGTARGIMVDGQSGQAAFKNDLDGGMPFFPTAAGNGKMYQLVSAINFMDAAELSGSARMKEVAATLTEESNHVLVVATLK